jgi:hypothetical protein
VKYLFYTDLFFLVASESCNFYKALSQVISDAVLLITIICFSLFTSDMYSRSYFRGLIAVGWMWKKAWEGEYDSNTVHTCIQMEK